MALALPENISIVASLLQEDLAELQQGVKGGGEASTTGRTDEEQALELYAQELAGLVQTDRDARLARSLAAASATDAAVLDAAAREEERARSDHAFALRVSEHDTDEDDEDYDEEDTNATPPSRPDSTPPVRALAVSAFKVRPIASTSQLPVECTICGDPFPINALVRVPCPEQHPYCHNCLHSLFLAATKDESLFPPRCDGAPIPLDLARPYLTPAELAAYERKSREFGTPNRLYCSTSTCSTFLGGASTSRAAVRCEACGASTCAACKAPWHGPFGLCGASGDDEAAATLERDHAYKRCPSCKRVVELDTGCYHIYCHCSNEFCYLCAAKWKTCACPIWDERRLYRAAHAQNEERARQAAAPAVAPVVAQEPAAVPQPANPYDVQPVLAQLRAPLDMNLQAFADIMRNARDPRPCRHQRTVKVEGADDCEVCGAHMRQFVLRCTQCHTSICVRCRRNRVRGE
ncbi:hypothetical protein JCM10450v2_002354 [Rhodotorula kratochvilovae]